jgi:hypothetical protein
MVINNTDFIFSPFQKKIPAAAKPVSRVAQYKLNNLQQGNELFNQQHFS